MRWALTAVAWVALGCASPPTQLIVVIETNLAVPTELDTVEVSVLGPSGVAAVTTQGLTDPGSPTFPLTLGVSPETGELGPILVSAAGRLSGAEIVRQSAEVTLVPGETLTLHLVLYRSCVGRSCPAGATCDAMGCVSELRSDLPAWTGVPPTFDDSDPCLSMRWDGDGDGQGSVACGGTDCDDGEVRAFVGAVEDCDDIDNDCDGVVNEDCDCSPLALVEECATECGSRGDRTCTTSGWSACTQRPETCNGVDDDCDGLTDEDQTYVASMPTQITSTVGSSLEPDMVWAGDRYALVWFDHTDRDGIHIMALDPAGTPMGGPLRLSGAGGQPAIAWNGTAFGVTWWERIGTTDPCCDPPDCLTACTTYTDPIFFVVGDSLGMMSAPVQVRGDADNRPRPSIVWNGTSFVLGYSDGALFLEPWGVDAMRVAPRYQIPTARREPFDLVSAGTRIAIAFAANDNLFFSHGGLGAFPASETNVSMVRRATQPSLAWTGDGYVIAANARDFLGAGRGVAVVGLDALGAPRGMATTLTETRTGGFADEGPPPSVAAAPGQLLVTWVDESTGTSNVWFARLAPDGTVLQAPAPLAVTPGDSGQTSAAWADGAFGVTWVEDPNTAPENLLFARVGCAP